MSSKAFSCFVEKDACINDCLDIICSRISNEIDVLDLVILVFDKGITEHTRINMRKHISNFVRMLTPKPFQIGIVKKMTKKEYIERQLKAGIPTFAF